MKISVVIRAYNEAAHVEKLLVGIHAQSHRPHEVILVDSGSTDDTVAIARDYGVKVVAIDKHEFTFGRALNIGCAAATGDILVFASAHVYPVHSDWLERLVAPFADSRVVLSYGRQRGNHLNKFSEHQIFARWFPAESVKPQRSYFCNNANCAVRRTAWEGQPYDETLTGLEDLAWAKAAQAAGGWIAYVAEAEIVHVHDESWAQVMNRYRREAIAMRSIDEHAGFTRLDLVTLLARNIVSDLGSASAQRVLLREWSSVLKFRYNQLVGTYMGYNGPPELSAELRARFYYPAGQSPRAAASAVEAREQLDYDRLMVAVGSTAVSDGSARKSTPGGSGDGTAMGHVIPFARSSQ